MMLPSHLLATVLLGLVLAAVRPMPARAWALLLVFGVLIDLDHLLQLPRYLATHGGLAALGDPAGMSAWGAEWQGVFHRPIALLVVVAVALALRSPLPLVGWGLHMVLDFVVATRLVRFGGPTEWAIVAALAAAVLAVAWTLHGPPVAVARRAALEAVALVAPGPR